MAQESIAEKIKAYLALNDEAESLKLDNLDEFLYRLNTAEEELRVQNEELIHKQSETIELQAKFSNLFFNAPIALLQVDSNLNIIESNHHADQLLAVNRSRQHNLHVKLLNLFEQTLDRRFDQWLFGRDSETRSIELKRQNESRWFHFTRVDLPDNKTLIAVVETTQQNIIVEAERQIALAQAAVEADRNKSEFLANMWHELRTPLHAILSFTHMLKKKAQHSLDASGLSYLENIQVSSKRLLNLVNDLLDLSKLEAGRTLPTMAYHDLNQLSRNIIESLSGIISEKNLTIELIAEKQQLQAYFDRSLIEKVITNLLSNAIKFSPQQTSIEVEIFSDKLEWRDRFVDMAYVTVTDHGVGIPKAELDSIFDKFVQSSKTDDKSGGTGLGLAISKEIIDLHQGKIWADSPLTEEATGSRLSFCIPMHKNH